MEQQMSERDRVRALRLSLSSRKPGTALIQARVDVRDVAELLWWAVSHGHYPRSQSDFVKSWIGEMADSLRQECGVARFADHRSAEEYISQYFGKEFRKSGSARGYMEGTIRRQEAMETVVPQEEQTPPEVQAQIDRCIKSAIERGYMTAAGEFLPPAQRIQIQSKEEVRAAMIASGCLHVPQAKTEESELNQQQAEKDKEQMDEMRDALNTDPRKED